MMINRSPAAYRWRVRTYLIKFRRTFKVTFFFLFFRHSNFPGVNAKKYKYIARAPIQYSLLFVLERSLAKEIFVADIIIRYFHKRL